MPPQQLGPYQLLRELRRGHTGIVYEAAHPERPNQRLVLKLLRSPDDPKVLARFRREADVLARLSHRSILHVIDLLDTSRGPCLVTEFVDGATLEDWARTHHQPQPRAALIRELADALAAAHTRGALHRDIRPDNVLVRTDDRPVLMDFGLAWTHHAQRLTQTGEALGHSPFMSPEQARGTPSSQLTPAVDVWGLGALLFWLLTETPPFQQPPWRALRNTPAPLARVCRRALADDPAKRYPSAAALRDDLDAALAPPRRSPHAWRKPVLLGASLTLLATLAWLARPAPATPPPTPETADATDTHRDDATPLVVPSTPPRTPRELHHPAMGERRARFGATRARPLDDTRWALLWRRTVDEPTWIEVRDFRQPDEPLTIYAPSFVGDVALLPTDPPQLLATLRVLAPDATFELASHPLEPDDTGRGWRSLHGTTHDRLVEVVRDGSRALVNDAGTLRLIDPTSGRPTTSLDIDGHRIDAILPLDDEVVVACNGTFDQAGADENRLNDLIQWNLRDGSLRTFATVTDIRALALHRRTIFLGDTMGAIFRIPLPITPSPRLDHLHGLGVPKPNFGNPRAHQASIRGLTAADGLLISISGGRSANPEHRQLRLWDLTTDPPQNTLVVDRFPISVAAVVSEPDSRWLVIASYGNAVWLWPLDRLRTLRGSLSFDEALAALDNA